MSLRPGAWGLGSEAWGLPPIFGTILLNTKKHDFPPPLGPRLGLGPEPAVWGLPTLLLAPICEDPKT
jgi:hypothetical protein